MSPWTSARMPTPKDPAPDATVVQRAEHAAHASLVRAGAFHGRGVGADDVRNAIVAALEVLAEEFGPRPEDAAPPVRELPSEPGRVVLITAVCGVTLDQPRPAIRDGGPSDSDPWDIGVACDVADGRRFLGDSDITDWLPATVVPTAAHEAAVKALRDVVALLEGPQSGDAQEAQDTARRALHVLDGEVS